MNRPDKIIDFHAHIFPEKIADKAVLFLSDYYGYPIAKSGLVGPLIKSAAGYDIEKIIVHSSATNAAQVQNVNNFVSEMCAEYDKFVGFGTIHPDYNDIGGEIERIISMGLKGIKLHPVFQNFKLDDPKAMKIYECIEGRLPLLTHMGDKAVDNATPKRLVNVLDAFPKLTVIGAHLGGYMEWDDSEKYLVGRDLYFDCSSSVCFMEHDRAVKIMRAHGVDRILFGTDYPMFTHEQIIELMYQIGMTDDELEKIMYKNAKKLLNRIVV